MDTLWRKTDIEDYFNELLYLVTIFGPSLFQDVHPREMCPLWLRKHR